MRVLLIVGVLALAAAGCGPAEGAPPVYGPGIEAVHILDFPAVEVGKTATASTLVRAGTRPTFLEPVQIEAPFSSDLREVTKLEPAAERTIVFTFTPTEPGSQEQEVEIRSTGVARRFRLRAEALPAPEPCRPAERRDSFPNVRPVQDVLLVVDDHKSMNAVREELVRQVTALPTRLYEAGIEWRLAVTTTGVGDGCLGGTLQGELPFLHADDDVAHEALLEEVLRTPVCDGNAQGLVAAGMALAEGDFRRPGAGLSLVVISTRDDRSPGAVADHVAALRAMADRPALVRSLVVVGEDGGKCILAEPGRRYVETAAALGGARRSLCEADWGLLDFFAPDSTFGIPVDWKLGATPVDADGDGAINPAEGEIVVRIDGEPIGPGGGGTTTAWTYDAGTNAVVFVPQAQPKPGQTLEIDYVAACPSADSVRSTSPSSL